MAAAEGDTQRPTDFAVGHHHRARSTTRAGRSTTTVYYPATGRAEHARDRGRAARDEMGSVPADPVQPRPRGDARRRTHALLHAWADAGYVVAVPTYAAPTDAEADENGQFVVDLGERVTDASFVIDRMLDRVQGGFGSIVDRKHIAAAGHALGATTTYVLAYAHRGADPRIRAVVTIGGSLAGDSSRLLQRRRHTVAGDPRRRRRDGSRSTARPRSTRSRTRRSSS